MWNHSQAMAAEFARRGMPRVTFSGEEMADIIAYLYFVNYANVRGRPIAAACCSSTSARRATASAAAAASAPISRWRPA